MAGGWGNRARGPRSTEAASRARKMPSRWRGRRPQSKFEVAADEDGRPDSMTTVCHSASQTSSQAVGCSRGRRCSLSVSFVVMLATKGAALLEEHSRTFGDRPCGCPRLRVSSNVFLLPYAGIQFPSGYLHLNSFPTFVQSSRLSLFQASSRLFFCCSRQPVILGIV